MLRQAALCLDKAEVFVLLTKNHSLRVTFRVGLPLAERWRKCLFPGVFIWPDYTINVDLSSFQANHSFWWFSEARFLCSTKTQKLHNT